MKPHPLPFPFRHARSSQGPTLAILGWAALLAGGLAALSGNLDAHGYIEATPFPGSVKTTHEDGSVHSSNLPLTVSFFDPDISLVTSSFTLSVDGTDQTSKATLKTISLGMRLTCPLSLGRSSRHHYAIQFQDDSQPPQRYFFQAYFDTDARGAGDFIIELEDFNYSKGKSKPEASVMPYMGLAYKGLSGSSGTDYLAHEAGDDLTDNYRDGEKPNVSLLPTRNRERSGFLADGSFLLAAGAGDWFQYTRNFPTNYYDVYAALSSGSLGDGVVGGRLFLSPTPSSGDSPGRLLGTFTGTSTAGWGVSALIPLIDPAGRESTILPLGGETSLRFECGAGLGDYLLFVPTDRVALLNARIERLNRFDPGDLVVSWAGNGALLQSENLDGPYLFLDHLDTSPARLRMPPSGLQRFFKVIPRASVVDPGPDGGD
ncbi:MAG: hypothetical protein HYR88_14305 [Verrucomicrobia bacterium]|nr:hypothetical protein [Verrucomicrobiota bacterium]MBI3870698.1 hypothetical protein [Verrucomicrobiota bacterium]